MPPCRLSLPAKVVGKARRELDEALQAKFVALWNEHSAQAFDEAEACADLEKAHVLWNTACETFFLRYCSGSWEAELPADRPRRGQVLPRQAQALESGFND